MENEKIFMHSVIIIGGGVAGLMAQRVFHSHGVQSLIIDKGRSLGGRCSTRRSDEFRADHGPQYFNPRVLESISSVDSASPLMKAIEIRMPGLHRRTIFINGISQIKNLIAPGPTADLKQRVQKIERDRIDLDDCYRLSCESGKMYFARNLVLTPPVPQALTLLENLPLSSLAQENLTKLREIQYQCCIAVIFLLETPISIGGNGIWKDCSPQITGIYNQLEKGLDTKKPALVIHVAHQLSLALWNKSDPEIENAVISEISEMLTQRGVQLKIEQSFVHKWKFAEPEKVYPAQYALLGEPKRELALAGDGFARSSIGGAIESGRAAALALIQQGI